MSLLEVNNLSFNYGSVSILKNISFSIDNDEIAVFLGRSGVGKTTFLKLIAGLEHPSSGTILKEGQELSSDNIFVSPHKRRIGVVFQEDSLFHHLTIEENIKLARKNQDPKVLEELLDLFKIGSKRYRYPNELSGGQKQRVALARALYQKPDIILFDEPFSALDGNLRLHLRQKIKSWLKKNSVAGLFITHDKEEAIHLADKLIILENGRITASGTPADVLSNPTTKSIAEFLEAGILLDEFQAKELAPNLFNNQIEEKDRYFIPYSELNLTAQEGHGVHCIITDIRTSIRLETHYFVQLPGQEKEFGPFTIKDEKKLRINDIGHLVLNTKTHVRKLLKI